MGDSFSTQEIFLIVVIALVVVGPHDLVRVAGKLGRLMGEIKRQFISAQAAIEKEIEQVEQAENLKRLEEESHRIATEIGVPFVDDKHANQTAASRVLDLPAIKSESLPTNEPTGVKEKKL